MAVVSIEAAAMTYARHPRSHAIRMTHDDDDSARSFSCFGIGRRSKSPSTNDLNHSAQPRFDPWASGTVHDPLDPTVTELKGYSIQGKSAEILGLMPKSLPATPPKSRASSPSRGRMSSRESHPQSKEPSIESTKSTASLRQLRAPMLADPLINVRRRLRGETNTSSNVRSNSAPSLARNYSRKWRKSHQVIAASERGSNDFFDASSGDTSVKENEIPEDEIPDTNKFDQALGSSKENATRIQSAAYTTFAWMQLQEEALNLISQSGTEKSRSSWLLDDGKSYKSNVITANESRKRTSISAPGSAGSDAVKRDDKRDTLEWMGVKPGDFPIPVATA